MERVARSREPLPKQKARPPSPPPIIANKRGQNFTIGKFLGQGGFARCYSVQDEHERIFAVKVVHKPSLKTTKQRSKVFCFLD
jgi:hypothetical protein